MTDDYSKINERLQRQYFRENIHRIWTMIKSGMSVELTEQDHKLAIIIMNHKEYREHFENKDILDGREYEAGDEFNPFLHISFHQMVEDQLSSNSPKEAALFCEAMQDNGISHHNAVHYIMMILTRIIYDSIVNNKSFDTGRYKRLLTRCRKVEPSQIEEAIERDFLSS